ncbi:MAG: Rrf2 family transcriptional regulator [Alphaproteobacteria bacterium]|nr:Rrf2 family transcriptional regulator [Alphaproteobacteria bacterium]MCD8566548.1 Rrf2 family transcriptional regulator [Alphaproteobacteria bacterium]
MHLTQQTNYALRMLMYLAVAKGPVTIADIAERHAISRNHLVKIAHKLSRQGYVRSRQGRGGGIELAADPEKVSVGEIVRLTEDNMELVECFSPTETDISCKLKSFCRLRKTFVRALDAFMEELDSVSLADISGNPIQIRKALGL